MVVTTSVRTPLVWTIHFDNATSETSVNPTLAIQKSCHTNPTNSCLSGSDTPRSMQSILPIFKCPLERITLFETHPLWLKNCTSSAAKGFTWFYIFIFIHVPLSCICSIPIFSHTLRSMIFPDVPNMNFTIFHYFFIVFQVPLHWVPLAMRARLSVISGLPYPAKGINPMFKVRKSITTKEYFKIQRPQSKWHPNHKLNDSQFFFK